MAQGTLRSEQADFGAGIYRGREAPDNAAYDLLNCLIDDEGQPFRRGGSVYRSTSNAGAAITGLDDLILAPGARSLIWTAAPSIGVVSDAGVVTMHALGTVVPRAGGRLAPMAAGYAAFPATDPPSPVVYAYAGSTKTTYTTGTITLTQGSRTVTGVGTSWLANVEPGSFITPTAVAYSDSQDHLVVESVQSNTSLKLTQAWVGATTAGAGYTAAAYTTIGGFGNRVTSGDVFLAAVGSPPRLLMAVANLVFYTPSGNGRLLTDTAYHELPSGALCTGIESGMGWDAAVFTTAGVYAISNLEFDAIDDAGNIQHNVTLMSELLLWGDSGLAKWQGAIVVPAVDNVWLMPFGGAAQPIGDGIRPLYLSYVKAGYQPGIAAVHRGHYVLPILNGTTLVDVLVCRLDRGFAWTRWSGHGAGTAYAQRVGATTRSPKLFSVNGQRVTDLTDAWSPSASNASEADTTTHPLTIETRDLSTAGGAKGSTTRKVKVRYQATAVATPAFTVSYARGPEDAAYTSLGTAIRGGVASDGLDESVWPVGKQAPAIRFRISSTSALSTFTLRELTAEYTPRGA